MILTKFAKSEYDPNGSFCQDRAIKYFYYLKNCLTVMRLPRCARNDSKENYAAESV